MKEDWGLKCMSWRKHLNLKVMAVVCAPPDRQVCETPITLLAAFTSSALVFFFPLMYRLPHQAMTEKKRFSTFFVRQRHDLCITYLKSFNFLKKHRCCWPFLETTSQFAWNVRLLSIIVPKYLGLLIQYQFISWNYEMVGGMISFEKHYYFVCAL